MNTPPVSTYRFQLDAHFDFEAVRALLPYLRALGIDWLYLAPLFAARPGSPHGYDVIDPTRVNDELGGRAGLEQLASAAHAEGLGILLDIVPNHEAVTTANPKWDALLREGRAGHAGNWFDIDWSGNELVAPDKVLWGLLGHDVDDELTSGALRVVRGDDGDAYLRYGDETLPCIDTAADDTDVRAALARQHYVLAHWRAARVALNYRRFFDVSELAGVRVEDADVFDASHVLVFELVRDGVIDGIRVDHVDGLAAPGAYLARLTAALPRRPVFVEKILAADEALPADWDVAGTTGYETVATLTAALVDPDGMVALGRIARGSEPVPFRDVELAAKRQVLDDLLVPEWRRVRTALDAAAAASGIATDRDVLATALREITVALDVYRTYAGRDPDRIGRAIVAARDRGMADPAALDAVRELLTGSTDASRALLVRWEQLSGAVMAKGHEDTAEYRVSAALALADVGGDPGDDARDAVARFHAQQAARITDGRAGMTATTTHDTKRSEDTRARLAALTEHADAYAAGFARWLELLAPPAEVTRTVLDFVAQTLLATWPLSQHEHEHGRYADRITSYLVKARREAKEETSWLAPDADAETRLLDVARRTLGDDGRLFRDAFGALIDDVAWFGAVNGLAQLTWKLGAPGTADIYRGAELWDLHLVDPDNRGPVDFDTRMTLLREPSDDWRSGAVKLHMTAAGLRARAAHPDLFRSGEYLPLAVPDDAALAFARHDGHAWALACAPRLPARLAPRDHWPVGDAIWGDRALELPTGAPARWRDAYTDADVTARDGRLRIADVLTRLPAALLLSD